MTAISDRCGQQLYDQGLLDQGMFILEWITIREYKRAHGTIADVQRWDAAAAKAWADLKANPSASGSMDVMTSLVNAFEKAYGQAMVTFIVASPNLPGWNDTTCRMDWHTYACFAYYAAGLTAAEIVTLTVGKMPSFTCPEAVKTDPAYNGEMPMPNGPAPSLNKPSDTNWIPWAVGGVAVVGLGVAGYMLYGKKHQRLNMASSNPLNPARSSGVPSKAEQNTVIEALANYMSAHGAGIATQQRLYDRYMTALGKLEKKYPALDFRAAEVVNSLENAARKRLSLKPFAGPGSTY